MPAATSVMIARLRGAALGVLVVASVVIGAAVCSLLGFVAGGPAGLDRALVGLLIGFAAGVVLLGGVAALLGHAHGGRDAALRVAAVAIVPLVAWAGTWLSPLLSPLEAPTSAALTLLTTAALSGAALLTPFAREEASCPRS